MSTTNRARKKRIKTSGTKFMSIMKQFKKNQIMENQNQYLVTGMFRDKDSAERAYNSLQSKGYSNNDVHLIMSDNTRKKHFVNEVQKTDLGSKAVEGMGTGSAIGGTLGAIAGAVAAI